MAALQPRGGNDGFGVHKRQSNALGSGSPCGTDYDLRGSLELRWGDGSGGDQGMFPLRSVGIKVPLMPIAAFHVLMFAPTGAPTAEPYAYANVRALPRRQQHIVADPNRA